MKEKKMIPRAERLIVALDVPTPKEARALAEQLGDAVRFYKIGLELFTSDGTFELLGWLSARGNKVFADLKLYDIPETVRRAVANLRGQRRDLPHGARPSLGDGGGGAREGRHEDPGGDGADELRPARPGGDGKYSHGRTTRAGAREKARSTPAADGVISSGHEAKALKRSSASACSSLPRESGRSKRSDDQKRTVDVAQAFANGADYIVVGPPDPRRRRPARRRGSDPGHDQKNQGISFSSSRRRCSWCGSITPSNSVSPPRFTRMVGKFSTSMSSTSAAWSSMSTQRNSARGKRCAMARKPSR
jgi:orotidine-5'-phosphate decarboxylase